MRWKLGTRARCIDAHKHHYAIADNGPGYEQLCQNVNEFLAGIPLILVPPVDATEAVL
jgi:hypothetical protein